MADQSSTSLFLIGKFEQLNFEQTFFRAWFCKLKPPYSKKLENFIKMG